MKTTNTTPKRRNRKRESARETLIQGATELTETQLEEVSIVVPTLASVRRLILEIRGISPLIVNKFSNKAIKSMGDKQQGKAVGKKDKRKPEEDFLGAFYFLGSPAKKVADLENTRFGFRAVCFKAAAVRGAQMDGEKMEAAKRAFFVRGFKSPDDPLSKQEYNPDEFVEIVSPETPWMREDYARNTTTMDLRYRPQFDDWGTTLEIDFISKAVTTEMLLSWFQVAGFGNGVGEMRPGGRASSHMMGRFEVASAREIRPKGAK